MPSNRRRTGKFAGVPYDWRKPTWQRVKSRWWNPKASFITPKSYGWGYDFNLYKIRYILLLGVWAVTILIAAYLGDMFALRSTSFQTVTPTQLANAMKQDDFYATYRENTVIFSGTVTSVSSNGSETNVGIKTASSYSLTCDLANGSNQSHKVGDTRKFAAEAYRANREPAGVLLKGCVVL